MIWDSEGEPTQDRREEESQNDHYKAAPPPTKKHILLWCRRTEKPMKEVSCGGKKRIPCNRTQELRDKNRKQG